MKTCLRCKKVKGPGHKCTSKDMKEPGKKINPYMKALGNGK